MAAFLRFFAKKVTAVLVLLSALLKARCREQNLCLNLHLALFL